MARDTVRRGSWEWEPDSVVHVDQWRPGDRRVCVSCGSPARRHVHRPQALRHVAGPVRANTVGGRIARLRPEVQPCILCGIDLVPPGRYDTVRPGTIMVTMEADPGHHQAGAWPVDQWPDLLDAPRCDQVPRAPVAGVDGGPWRSGGVVAAVWYHRWWDADPSDKVIWDHLGSGAREAKRRGMKVALQFRDQIPSNSHISQRPQLMRLFEYLRKNPGTTVLLLNYKALGNSIVIQEAVIREIRRIGCYVEVINPMEYGLDNPEVDRTRAMWREGLAQLDGEEPALRALRAMSMSGAALPGMPTHHGRPPYGWISVDGHLVEHPDEQRIIAKIVAFRRSGMGRDKITKQLIADGEPTRSGGTWIRSTVGSILTRAGETPVRNGKVLASPDTEGYGA